MSTLSTAADYLRRADRDLQEYERVEAEAHGEPRLAYGTSLRKEVPARACVRACACA